MAATTSVDFSPADTGKCGVTSPPTLAPPLPLTLPESLGLFTSGLPSRWHKQCCRCLPDRSFAGSSRAVGFPVSACQIPHSVGPLLRRPMENFKSTSATTISSHEELWQNSDRSKRNSRWCIWELGLLPVPPICCRLKLLLRHHWDSTDTSNDESCASGSCANPIHASRCAADYAIVQQVYLMNNLITR